MSDEATFWDITDELTCPVCLEYNLSGEDTCERCRSCSSCESLVCRCIELYGFVPHLTDELVIEDGQPGVLRPVRPDDYDRRVVGDDQS